jgi:hypothetical protein
MITQLQFNRRQNYDSTEDSICMSCFLRIARGDEATLEDAEEKHNCEQAILEECARHEDSQRGTF